MKRNTFQSALMRWMNLEPIKQSEVSQKEEVKYYTITHNHTLTHTFCFVSFMKGKIKSGNVFVYSFVPLLDFPLEIGQWET